MYALLWLVYLPIRLWWLCVVMPSRTWTTRLLQPRCIAAEDPLSRRLGVARTIVVAIGAALAELQWRWGTAEFGASLWDWVEGFFTGPIALALSVVVFAVVFPLCARRGERRLMLRRSMTPVLVVLAAGVLLATLPLVVAAFSWMQSARQTSMVWASDGLYWALTVCLGIVLFAVWLYFPPMLVLGAWKSARGSFRAGDAHPLMPAASTILAGVLLATGPVIDAVNGVNLDPDMPLWAALMLSVAVPVVTIALSVVELVRLMVVGRWSWRSVYVPVASA